MVSGMVQLNKRTEGSNYELPTMYWAITQGAIADAMYLVLL